MKVYRLMYSDINKVSGEFYQIYADADSAYMLAESLEAPFMEAELPESYHLEFKEKKCELKKKLEEEYSKQIAEPNADIGEIDVAFKQKLQVFYKLQDMKALVESELYKTYTQAFI